MRPISSIMILMQMTIRSFILLFWATICTYTIGQAQILRSSHLPIIRINTSQAEIPDEPKIPGSIEIIENGGGNLNSPSDPPSHYQGPIGIEVRGNSTQDFEKKTYAIELRDDADNDFSAPLLGMGKEEDWILHAMVIDKSQLRIPYSFYLWQRMGHYAANWRYVELILNGEYRGLYILTERIKRDDDRVDIAKLSEEDLSGDALTGGYILRIDWLEESQGFESQYKAQGGEPIFFQWYYPRADRIQPEQAAYIESWIANFENALFAEDYHNARGERYSDLIHLASFADFLLINEFSKNSDGYKLSSYIHKDRDSRGGLLVAGPIWDFDQTYGISEVCSNDNPRGWTYRQDQDACEDLESMPLWWQKMVADDTFRELLSQRWSSFRSTFLHQDSIYAWIDKHRDFIAPAIERNFTRWDEMIGEFIWFEPEPLPESYEEEILQLKSRIAQRLDWMDANLPLISGKKRDFFRLFPNPTSGILNLQAPEEIETTVYDLSGRTLLYSTDKELDLSALPAGAYVLKLRIEDWKGSELVIKH
ncbi:MAG: CotH kinase family protein [Bacteroidota bacterium]